MAPIQVYSESPINAAKAQGATSDSADKTKTAAGVAPAPAAPTSQASNPQYQPAQPGAQPSLPVQTGAPQQPYGKYAPTPTQTSQSVSPPAPQPGAVPQPPSAKADLPPPPKAGESLKPEHMGAPTGTQEFVPPQMSYAPPTAPAPSMSRGTAAAVPPPPQPQLFGGAGPHVDTAHPPGYHQDVHASEFSSQQRAAHNAYVSENSTFGDSEGDGGLWDQAKKWASAAGDSLAAAEHEVWKKINKE
ncbi:hypothetical protein K4F52_002962 [Lecanicillium sp. MT-2017a]|nr:hypothetical protein K4F52_002962 [Lecanicillium sp. MT-2017a]